MIPTNPNLTPVQLAHSLPISPAGKHHHVHHASGRRPIGKGGTRPPPLTRRSQSSGVARSGPATPTKVEQNTDEDDSMAASFLQFCATCEKQIVVPNNSILYCSESCRHRDIKSIGASSIQQYRSLTNPLALSELSLRHARRPDILPRALPTPRIIPQRPLSYEDYSSDENSSPQSTTSELHYQYQYRGETPLQVHSSNKPLTPPPTDLPSASTAGASSAGGGPKPSPSHKRSTSSTNLLSLNSAPGGYTYARKLPPKTTPRAHTSTPRSIELVAPLSASLPAGGGARRAAAGGAARTGLGESLSMSARSWAVPRVEGGGKLMFRFEEMQGRKGGV
ncbi:MAG: hypothetical protein M1829_002220 [Trizodia sp. TS-e1964]|nr:MAG: hypothetical protein M1829_002220 [Trizodia sp. TS-e1964]